MEDRSLPLDSEQEPDPATQAFARLEGEMALVLKNLEGFTKSSDGNYYNKQYENAKNRIIININSGVSKFKINTY